MKGFSRALATAATLLMVTASADAQPRPRCQERGDDRDHRFGRSTLDRVRADLNHAQRSLHYITPPDMRRYMEAREGLANFHRSWKRGRYYRPELDQPSSICMPSWSVAVCAPVTAICRPMIRGCCAKCTGTSSDPTGARDRPTPRFTENL